MSDGWKPIDSAPKDGSIILAWSEDMDEVLAIVWAESRGGSWRLAGCSSLELGSWGQPTHWMPLPAPPDNSSS